MGYRNKQVTKTRRVAKTRQIPGSNGGYATEIYYVDEPYTVTESVWEADTSSSSSDCSSGGSYE